MIDHDTKGNTSPTLSVIFSFRNEEEVIPELLRRVSAVLDGERKERRIGNCELIFVNDASTDRSLELLVEAARVRNDIKVINMSRTFGVSEGVLAGMKYAKGDAVIYMDADLQDPPEVIPQLIEKWRTEGVDVVSTVRRIRVGEPPFKMWLTRLGYRIINYVSFIDIPMNAGDFKLLSRRVVNEILELQESKPFLRGLVSWVGFSQAQVLYDRDARHAGKTKFPIYGRKVIGNFLDSAIISFSDVPLKISLLVGFVVSFGAFLFLIWVFIQKFLGWAIPGWSAIVATILVLGGFQLMTIGVLGLYIGSILRDVKRRPRYIVKDTLGFENDPAEVKEPSEMKATNQSGDA